MTEIAKDFKKDPSDVSWGITVTLMLRAVGALISGSIGDRFGRKWIFIGNLVMFIVFELCSAFCNSLGPFLAVRALYGICMGGLLAPAATTALEDLPYDARGIASGLFQQGCKSEVILVQGRARVRKADILHPDAVGYLLAAIFYRALVPTTSHGWRSLFYFGACGPVPIIIWRFFLPETNYYQVIRAERDANHAAAQEQHASGEKKTGAMRAFLKESNQAFRKNWFLFVYMVVLMSGMNSVSHGSQDLYPTFLKDQVGFGPTKTTVTTVVGQLGAIVGSTTIGFLSTFFGRRLCMLIACVFGGAIVPAYILPRTDSLIASVFFEQVFVGGVWGPM